MYVFTGQKLGSALRKFSILLETSLCCIKPLPAVICSRKNVYTIVVGREAWDVCFPLVLSLLLECVLCPRVLKHYSGHRADVVGAVSALVGLLALEGMRVASVNSMIL